MSQVGEQISDKPVIGDKKCVFCDADHQDEKEADPVRWTRDMPKLKKEGREVTISGGGRAFKYPHENEPPLVAWAKVDIKITRGYKAAAHHCLSLCEINDHKISGELKKAGYDPNRGNNCIWLPYSTVQFYRARALGRPLQKHRGGHTNAYFKTVRDFIDLISKKIKRNFCTVKKKASADELLNFASVIEGYLWNGIANSVSSKYHLYNNSYLDPHANFPSNLKERDILDSLVPQLSPEEEQEDSKAEDECQQDLDDKDDGGD